MRSGGGEISVGESWKVTVKGAGEVEVCGEDLLGELCGEEEERRIGVEEPRGGGMGDVAPGETAPDGNGARDRVGGSVGDGDGT